MAMTPTLRPDLPDEPIAAHVRRDFITLQADHCAGESLASLRSRVIGEKIVYFYVVDAEGRLVGVVPTRRLLMSEPATPISDLMVRHVVALPQTACVIDACQLFMDHRLLALPVVDADRRMLGVVDITVFTEELSDVAERQAIDDAFQLIGVRIQSTRERSPWISVRFRLPWLLFNVLGGMACALLASRYEVFLDHFIVLALFIPVVLSLAESVSIQSTTITLQSLHKRRLGWSFVSRALRREFAIAGMLGLACGGLVALIAYVWKGQPQVSFALGASIALAMLTACLLGVALPVGVRALRGDPRIAAGPVVLACADIATLSMYFWFSARLLGADAGAP